MSILIVICFVAGSLLLLYPIYANYMYSKMASEAQQSYEANNAATDAASKNSQLAAASSYNASLNPTVLIDPFSSGTQQESVDKGYYDILNVTSADNISGVMGFIEIPKIDVNLPVFHGTSDEVLNVGAGHLIGSSLPVGENGSHAVLTGHSGLPDKKLFTDLTKLETGDQFFITVLDNKMAYQIDDIRIVEPNDTSWFSIEPDQDLVTLLTCTPVGINDHRLLVTGHRIPYEEANTNVQPAVDWYKILVYLGIGITAISILIWFWKKHQRNKN